MADIKSIQVDGVDYAVNDESARNSIGDLSQLATEAKDDLVAAVNELSGKTGPIQRVESLDESNLKNLRDLTTGSYVLYGYFRPYAGASNYLPFDNLLVNVYHVNEGSHLFEFSTANSEVNFIEILVDSSAASGFTYSRTAINMLELNGLVSKLGNLNELATTEKGSVVAAINEVAASAGSGGVSSWNDLTDKPFYEEDGGATIEWNGVFDETYMFQKLSDTALTREQLIGATLTVTKSSLTEPVVITLTENHLEETSDPHSIVVDTTENGGGAFVVILPEGCTMDTTYTPGTYLFVGMAQDSGVTALSLAYEGTVIHTLDEKFIPDTIARASDAAIPDMAQNDETAKDYIKNRTHWEEFEAEKLLFENKGMALVESNTKNYYWGQTTEANGPGVFAEPGDQVKLLLNNKEYQGVAYADGDKVYVGNLSITDSTAENTGEDYLVRYTASGNMYFYTNTSTAYGSAVTISLYLLNVVTYHQLDEKFIPDTIARTTDIPTGADSLPMPATAAAGQFISVSAVDESGKVTETKAVNDKAGSLDDLQTLEKSSLVAAINEIVALGGGSISDEQVQNAISAYLTAHPVTAATDINIKKWFGKKIVVDGSSITTGGTGNTQPTWPSFLKDMFALSSVCNHAVSGTAWCTGTDNVIARISSYEADADAVILMGDYNGIYNYTSNAGSVSDAADASGSCYARLKYIAETLIAKYPLCPVIWVIEPPRAAVGETNGEKVPMNSESIYHAYSKVIEEVAELYGFTHCNLMKNTIFRPWIQTNYDETTSDGTHPWNNIQRTMAQVIAETMKRTPIMYNESYVITPGSSDEGTIPDDSDKTLKKITATFNQGDAIIKDTDDLSVLTQYLTVKATYTDLSEATLSDSAYTLSGELTEGTSLITVTYGTETTTFTVVVTHDDGSEKALLGDVIDEDLIGYYFAPNTGEVIARDGMRISKYLPVKAGSTITLSAGITYPNLTGIDVVYYDTDLGQVGTANLTYGLKELTVPEGASYFRIAFDDDDDAKTISYFPE